MKPHYFLERPRKPYTKTIAAKMPVRASTVPSSLGAGIDDGRHTKSHKSILLLANTKKIPILNLISPY